MAQHTGTGRLELCHARKRPDDVVQATRPPFDPGSPRPSRAHVGSSVSYVEEFWSPALLRSRKNRKLKHEHSFSFAFRAVSTEEPFSLGRGLILD